MERDSNFYYLCYTEIQWFSKYVQSFECFKVPQDYESSDSWELKWILGKMGF